MRPTPTLKTLRWILTTWCSTWRARQRARWCEWRQRRIPNWKCSSPGKEAGRRASPLILAQGHWIFLKNMLRIYIKPDLACSKITIDIICDGQENFLDRLVAQLTGNLFLPSLLSKLHPDHLFQHFQVVPSPYLPNSKFHNLSLSQKEVFTFTASVSPELCSQSEKICKLNIATGKTSQAITPFHFLDYFNFSNFYHKATFSQAITFSQEIIFSQEINFLTR